jgi:pilus assembly protein Flp/PilA
MSSLRLLPLRRLIADRRGATAIEYALIGGTVAAAIVAAATTIGRSLDTIFRTIVAAAG